MTKANISKTYFKIKNIFGLSIQLAKASFKIRNEGTSLGILWYLLDPIVFFTIMFILNQNILKSDINLYAVYLLIGLVMYNFFDRASKAASNVISANANFVKSIKINLEALVLAKPLQFTFSHLFEILILGIFLIFFKLSLVGILLYFLPFILLFTFSLGISFILASAGTFLKDLPNIWQIVSRLLLFVTPIFYMAEQKTWLGSINLLNPLTHYISLARDLIINSSLNLQTLSICLIISLISLVFGIIIFEKTKIRFAENI